MNDTANDGSRRRRAEQLEVDCTATKETTKEFGTKGNARRHRKLDFCR